MPSPNNIVLNRDEYHYVNMGPIKGKPDWHQQSKPSRYPFPTWRSAMAFAKAHKDAYPDREIIIDLPDGRRWDGQAWVA